MRKERFYYPNRYMLFDVIIKLPGTGLPQILKPAFQMTESIRKYTKIAFNPTCPTAYFSVIDRFQKAKHITCDK